ncbi:SDR family NAD(P)-dependent oxidoreductase [Amycolatopsis palatopharyngis]|uniref:SDR family NAD(P)-dependent oxidoreductase n=1 Tax=Amycolatopsis palatopharyngis TaxID=187982 RepID=UPI000E247F91
MIDIDRVSNLAPVSRICSPPIIGRIINVSSQLSQKERPELTHYSANKADVIGLTKAIAR